MTRLTIAAFEETIRASASKVGLVVEAVRFAKSELGGGLHDVNVIVTCTDPDKVHAAMQALETELIKVTGQPVRLGYYDAAIGYDVPKGKALLQVDCVILSD